MQLRGGGETKKEEREGKKTEERKKEFVEKRSKDESAKFRRKKETIKIIFQRIKV